MEVKCLEVRDSGTFIPVICIRPVADNEGQRYLLKRDGYCADINESCIIMISEQCHGVEYDPLNWSGARTYKIAHDYICNYWDELEDGDVIDVEFILGITSTKKISERITCPF
jgi:hypothetical protein